jgi:hypothetical protein
MKSKGTAMAGDVNMTATAAVRITLRMAFLTFYPFVFRLPCKGLAKTAVSAESGRFRRFDESSGAIAVKTADKPRRECSGQGLRLLIIFVILQCTIVLGRRNGRVKPADTVHMASFRY